MSVTLRELLHGVTAEPVAAVPVSGVACHSKQVRPGDVFVAVGGAALDGHAFIAEAVARGAAAIVAQQMPAAGSWQVRGCPCVVVRDTREALVAIAGRFFGHPSRRLRLIGVTGTNGKTTTTYLLKAILQAAGEQVGLLGTVSYHIGERRVPSSNTTPGPLDLQRYFAQMVAQGMRWCAMEVSSHALAQDRVAGLAFDAAVFTNLGSDHLDYHKTLEAYAEAKRRLFSSLRQDGHAVINSDDAYGRLLAETIPRRSIVTYAMDRHAKVKAREIVCTWEGIRFILESPWGVIPLSSRLIGRYNVWNLMAASAALLALGIPPEAIRAGVASCEGAPGRLEAIRADAGFRVLIDYAHTAEALRMALSAVRELTSGRVIVVFGCGGDRDQAKRPAMGRMAALASDLVVLTSDNPRGEDPATIIRQIAEGFPPGHEAFTIVPDREQAVAHALSVARAGDTVLIAGKGHEAYQVFEHTSVPFSDREVVERRLSLALSG
jgi:UDP-N-acetylmuramoyl-L-alanyl-D-glutamate--2,6-diaminopimelate ligase